MKSKYLIAPITLLLAALLLASGCSAPAEPPTEPAETPAPAVDPEPVTDPEPSADSRPPFTYESDVEPMLSGLTVLGVMEAIDVQSVSWYYEGDATGTTRLTLDGDSGWVELSVMAPEGSELYASDDENQSPELVPEELYQDDAVIAGAGWGEPGFALSPIRGVDVGASEQDVLDAFLCEDPAGDVFYGLEALNPQADESWLTDPDGFIGGRRYATDPEWGSVTEGIEYSWTNLEEPGEWHWYYQLRYELADGEVVGIYLVSYTDAE